MIYDQNGSINSNVLHQHKQPSCCSACAEKPAPYKTCLLPNATRMRRKNVCTGTPGRSALQNLHSSNVPCPIHSLLALEVYILASQERFYGARSRSEECDLYASVKEQLKIKMSGTASRSLILKRKLSFTDRRISSSA